LTSFRFFGLVGTWMEEDIIGESVANAFHQGCEEVFVVDNASPDRTVERAVSSGAVLAESYRTDAYDEPRRIGLMNAVMRRVSAAEPAERVWWLWFDADEFPHGPAGRPVKEHLASLDDGCRVVGARYFHHFPSGPPYHLPAHHPIECQPVCYEQHSNQVRCSHRKHPLVRIDAGRPPVVLGEGFHHYDCREPVLESTVSAFIHHFPFREPEATRRRMAALCGISSAGTARIEEQDRHEVRHYGAPSHLSQRVALYDAVYDGRWEAVAAGMPGRHTYEIVLGSWAERPDAFEVDVWYPRSQCNEAIPRGEADEQA